MDKVHEVRNVAFIGTVMQIEVDSRKYSIDLSKVSPRLASATQQQKENFEISPSGYGISWHDIDEDLSIDGLVGIKHSCPLIGTEKIK